MIVHVGDAFKELAHNDYCAQFVKKCISANCIERFFEVYRAGVEAFFAMFEGFFDACVQ